MEAWELDVLERAAACVARARYVIALTGAGLSVESGIPPFRGPGGLWTRHGEPPMDGYQRFLRDPRAAWEERLSPSGPLRELGQALAEARHSSRMGPDGLSRSSHAARGSRRDPCGSCGRPSPRRATAPAWV